jgi:transmembrane sensor
MTFQDNDEKALFDAAGWVAQMSDGPLNAEERIAFERWLAADPAHRRAMNEVEAQWSLAAQVSQPATEPWQAAARQRRPTLSFQFRRPSRLRGFLAAPLAAAIAIMVFAHPFRSITGYDSAVGESRLVTLDDGSQIRLNTETSITVTYDILDRRVKLERGEAEFTVAHKAMSSFEVDAPHAMIRVTGTHFLVRDTGNQTQIYLISGGIDLRDREGLKSLAKLQPGSAATVDADGHYAVKQSGGAEESAWLNGNLKKDKLSEHK